MNDGAISDHPDGRAVAPTVLVDADAIFVETDGRVVAPPVLVDGDAISDAADVDVRYAIMVLSRRLFGGGIVDDSPVEIGAPALVDGEESAADRSSSPSSGSPESIFTLEI